MSEFYLLNYELGGKVHTVWISEAKSPSDGGFMGEDLQGRLRVLSPSVPFSLSEKEELPKGIAEDVGGEGLEG